MQERRTRERLVSLDVFRGATIAGMLLVNNPGSWGAIYPPLRHAPWHGWTPTDLIFPFFVFIVGITTQLSVTSRRARGDDESAIRRQILKRGALIFLFGLLLNGFPFFSWGAVDGNPDATILQRVVDRLEHLRFMGVLQRIALAYVVSALIATRASVRAQVAITAVLLFGYWFVLTALPVPGTGMSGGALLDEPARTMAAYWDRVFLDWTRFGLGNHLWVNSQTWDPEGVLSTVGAIATAMLGNLAGRWIGRSGSLDERVSALFAIGSLAMVAGLVWSWWFPINKSLWTSSYVLFTGGMASVTLATVMWLVDVRGWRGAWTRPFVIYGVNPLIAFVGSGIMARLIYSIIKVEYDGANVSLQSAIYQSVFASWLSPLNASLGFALTFVVLWFGILALLYRRRIIVSV